MFFPLEKHCKVILMLMWMLFIYYLFAIFFSLKTERLKAVRARNLSDLNLSSSLGSSPPDFWDVSLPLSLAEIITWQLFYES